MAWRRTALYARDDIAGVSGSLASWTTTITLAMHCDKYAVSYVPINYRDRQGKSKIVPWDAGNFAILILRTADILKLFDVVYTMTRGGPGSATELVSVYTQRIGFRVFDQGMASAQAVILLIIATILSRLYVKYVYKEI